MKPVLVSYHRLFPLGNFANERIGVDVSLDEKDSPEAALDMARSIVEEYHKKNNPEEMGGTHERIIEQSPENPVQSIIHDIKNCKDLSTLQTYRLIAATNQLIQDAFNTKLKEFQ